MEKGSRATVGEGSPQAAAILATICAMSCALVPAAGSASRFGGGKLIAPVEGRPMLDRTIGALLEGGIEAVLVILPPDAAWRDTIRLLGDPRVRTRPNPDPSRGMFSSVQVGLEDLSDAPIAVLPADMPFVRGETVKNLLEVAGRTGAIVSPRYEGRRGHPVMLPADLREAILAAPATATLSDVLRPHAARFVNVDVADKGILRDVDVVEDLAP
jgi:molybdenum cofactor cytidylyltransferase